MRRSVLILVSASAIVALTACTTAFGAIYAFAPNNYMNACNSYPWIAHDSDPLNSHNVVSYFEDPATGPFVAQDGLVWMQKSSGTWSNGSQYQLFTPNLESWGLRITVSVQTAAGWQIVDDETCNNGGYAGYYFGSSQCNLPSNVTITGIDNVPHQTAPQSYGHPFPQVTATLQAWLDPALQSAGSSPYATYAQAVAASAPGSGVYVAQATFQVDVEDITSMPMDWPNWLGMNMPALVLKERAPLSGDADGNGTVDMADLSKVLTNYNRSGAQWADGDFDGNGTVDVTDLSKVLTNYNKTATAAGIKAVPEPGALALLAVGLAGLLGRGLRKRNSGTR